MAEKGQVGLSFVRRYLVYIVLGAAGAITLMLWLFYDYPFL